MKTPGRDLAAQVAKLKESDAFSVRSGNLPTWCPGCGYFGIHQGLNNAIRQLKLPHHMVVTVSGIVAGASGTITVNLGVGPNNNNSTGFFYVGAVKVARNNP